MRRRIASGCLVAATILITTASVTLPAASADAMVRADSLASGEQTIAPPPQRIQVFLNESEWEQMQAEGRQREAATQAGQPIALPPPVQQPNRPARTAPTEAALTPIEAEQTARQKASAPEAIDASTGSVAVTQDIGVLAAAPPVDIVPPQPQLDQCFSGGADDVFGRILNRFAYCQEQTLIAEYIIRINNFPDYKLGETEFRYETFAQGDELDRRIRVFARVQPDSVQYRWRTAFYNLFVAPNVPLTIIAECAENFLTCQATRGPVTLPFVTWNGNDDWFYWDVLSPTSAGTGRDFIAYARWYLDFETRFGRASADFETDLRQIRCDSATYFNRGLASYPYACIFNEAIPHLNYSTEDSEVRAVALHIEQAQTNPNSTYPLLVPPGFPPPPEGKRIPGRYVPGDPNADGLHRIRESVDPEYFANSQHKEAACYRRGDPALVAQYMDLWLPEPPDTYSEECDEYPFATTLEGAAHPDWDFSVRAVPDFQNSTAGGRLGTYLTDDRILSWDPTLPLEANDRFYVQIT